MRARSALPWSDGAAGPVLRLVEDAPPCATSGVDFFSEVPAEIEAAKALCATCPLRSGCLADALERREPHGVWAGELFVNGRPVAPAKPRKRTTPPPPSPGTPTSGGKVAGAVSLWCPNDHRRSVANTKTGGDGTVICLDCARKRSRRSRARKRQRRIPGTVSLWCANGHRRSMLNTLTSSVGYAVCLDCRRDRQARRHALKTPGRYRPIPGTVCLWCHNGHRRSVENTLTDGRGRTACRDCRRAAGRRRYAALKASGTRTELGLAS